MRYKKKKIIGLLKMEGLSPDEAMANLKEHVERIRRMGVEGPNLGDLRKVYLEMEFEETLA